MLKWLWRWLIWPCTHDWYVLVESTAESSVLDEMGNHGLNVLSATWSAHTAQRFAAKEKTTWLACKKCGELKKLRTPTVGGS